MRIEDDEGLSGVRTFFEAMRSLTNGTFEVEPISMTAVGAELVVTHTIDRMTLRGRPVSTDVVVVWRRRPRVSWRRRVAS